MVFQNLMRNVTLSRRICNRGLTSNFEVLSEIPAKSEQTLSDIVTVNTKKYKRIGSTRENIDKANEYLSSKPNLRILKDVIPASYFLKRPSNKTKARTFLVDNNVACDIFKVLQPHVKAYNGHVMEINAGTGILTEELLKAELKNLRIYETDAIFCNHLLEMIRRYNSDARLFKANLLHLGSIIKFDREDNIGRIESLFDGLPSSSWEDEPVVKILGAIPNEGFIRHIMFSIILQSGLCEFGRPELFLVLSQREYEKLKSTPSEERLYRSNSVIFQVLFDHEVLLRVPEKAFIPWFKAPTPKRGKNRYNEADTDLCFLKLTPKKDLLRTIPPNALRPFWFFVKFLMRKKSSLLIEKMENWIPGSGVRLISKGYTIFTDCGSLTPDQYLKIYLEFSSWPEFHSCSFLSSVESLLALVPIPNEFEKKLRQNPQMHDQKYAKAMFGSSSEMAPLVLPNVEGMHRIVYSITEYEPLLDSSNMTMADWSTIANDIHQAYEFYDGFVILHGTDTMSYTASALSFMLENLGKTVVITGAQISIFEVRSDGIDNFLSSLLIAGNFVIPEVTLFFNYKLLRGNRTTKISSESFQAFDSPNTSPLVIAGIHFEVDYRSIFRPCTLEKFVVHCKLNQNVGLLRVFPSIQTKTVETFLNPPTEGVVLETYGAGNMPSNRADLIEVIAKAARRGVLIINITQCSTGCVNPSYETGKMLYDSGVVPGYDMTPEAALTKLAYVLSKSEWDLNTKRNMMESNLRGELTCGKINSAPVMEDWDLIDAVARSMHISSPTEVKMLHAILFPAMLSSAVEKGDTIKIAELKNYGADISATNPDKRTPLHIACTIGDIKVVKFLLLNGASVHMKDRFDQTPLLDAVKHDHIEVIKLLRRCGAHLTLTPNQVGCQLCSAANYGNLKRLQSYHAAGANLGQPDISGRTALHQAALHKNADIVKFLLTNGVDPSERDLLGLTALDIAKKMEHQEIIDMLNVSVN